MHRNLKLQNVLLVGPEGDRDFVEVLDYSVSEDRDGKGRLRTGGLVGTPACMAPESLRRGTPTDARVNAYAFGVVLFELVTGQALQRRRRRPARPPAAARGAAVPRASRRAISVTATTSAATSNTSSTRRARQQAPLPHRRRLPSTRRPASAPPSPRLKTTTLRTSFTSARSSKPWSGPPSKAFRQPSPLCRRRAPSPQRPCPASRASRPCPAVVRSSRCPAAASPTSRRPRPLRLRRRRRFSRAQPRLRPGRRQCRWPASAHALHGSRRRWRRWWAWAW